MNFWKDPSQNAAKSIILIAMVTVVGVGIYQLAGNSTSLTGNVYRGTKKNPTVQTQPENIYVTINYAKDGSCVLTTCADGLTKNASVACVEYTGTTTTSGGEKMCSVDDTTLEQYIEVQN